MGVTFASYVREQKEELELLRTSILDEIGDKFNELVEHKKNESSGIMLFTDVNVLLIYENFYM